MSGISRVLNPIALTVSLVFSLFASANDRDFILPVEKNEIKVMSYNIQNLFDADHDENKNDYEFLPLSNPLKSQCKEAGRYAQTCFKQDWTNEKVNLKLEQIKLALEAQGPTPDILVLVEVENPFVVGALAEKLGYSDFRMTESPDKRGIDCAVLFNTEKLQLVKYVEQEIEKAMSPTRNLSAAVFKLNAALGGGILAVFPNHWPSQASPTEARTAAAKSLSQLVGTIRGDFKNKGDFNYILTGDFNTLKEEKQNPIEKILLSPKWDGGLIDVRQTALSNKKVNLPDMPEGTYFYSTDSAWNEFDHFFVNPELSNEKGLEVELSSFRIHSPSLLTQRSGKSSTPVPFRYNHNTANPRQLGFSDHFGIVMKLSYHN